MKTKLHALIEEQKALTAKFEEWLNSTTEESPTPDLKRVYIKGHPTRGAEVIKMLEDLGGVNRLFLNGTNCQVIYRIDDRNIVTNDVYVDNVNILIDYTELHLPEEVSAENAQTTDIKAGDWIQFTKVCEKIGKRQTNYLLTNIVDVKEVYDRGISVCIPNIGKTYHKFKCSSFHKVDPPKEEVEQLKFMTASDAIVGEVYTVLANNFRYIFIHNGFVSNDFKPLCVMRFDEGMEFLSIGGSLNANYPIIESSKAEKDYILKAIEYNGKHFDKENMRLLDVEEFSLKDGDPFICKMNGKLSVEVFAYYEEPFGVVSYNNYTCTPLMPFTHQTKHLIGTTDSPDKHYKFVV